MVGQPDRDRAPIAGTARLDGRIDGHLGEPAVGSGGRRGHGRAGHRHRGTAGHRERRVGRRTWHFAIREGRKAEAGSTLLSLWTGGESTPITLMELGEKEIEVKTEAALSLAVRRAD